MPAALAVIAGAACAAPAQPLWANSWRPELGFFDDGPTCLLDAPEPGEPDGASLGFSWTARAGFALFLIAPFGDAPSVHLETDDGAAWKISLQPPMRDVKGRRALLDAEIAEDVLRSLERGHELSVIVNSDGGSSRFRVPATGAQIGVPMYRACMKTVTDHPPRYRRDPGRPFLGSYKAGESCEFTQIIQLKHIAVMVTLTAMANGGEVAFERGLNSGNFEGPFWTRKTPDHVEPQALFGQDFDLLEEFRYRVTRDQLEELTVSLSQGVTRKFSLTNPEGERSTLNFGGSLGMPFAAMFAACRAARFSNEEPASQ